MAGVAEDDAADEDEKEDVSSNRAESGRRFSRGEEDVVDEEEVESMSMKGFVGGRGPGEPKGVAKGGDEGGVT